MFSRKHKLQRLCRKRIRLICKKNHAIDCAERAINRFQPDYKTVRYHDAKAMAYLQKINQVEYEILKMTNRED